MEFDKINMAFGGLHLHICMFQQISSNLTPKFTKLNKFRVMSD